MKASRTPSKRDGVVGLWAWTKSSHWWSSLVASVGHIHPYLRPVAAFAVGFLLALVVVGVPTYSTWKQHGGLSNHPQPFAIAGISAHEARIESQLIEGRADEAAALGTTQEVDGTKSAKRQQEALMVPAGGPAAGNKGGAPKLSTLKLRFQDLAALGVSAAMVKRDCPKGCLTHGTCNEELGRCDCPGSRGGEACDRPAMPACMLSDEHFTACHEPASCKCFVDCEQYSIIHWNICYAAERAAVYGNHTAFYASPQMSIATDWRGAIKELTPVTGAMSGWQYKALPLHLCTGNCSFRGWCREDLSCACRPGFSGQTCEQPHALCLNSCSERGLCVEGFCHCQEGSYGVDCSLSTGSKGLAQIWTGPETRGPKRKKGQRPRIFVYELPPHLNVWLHMHHLPQDRPEPQLFLERLLHSKYRTTNGAKADFFFVPAWIRWHGIRQLYVDKVVEYLKTTWPFWNATGGARHLWINTDDWGTCEDIDHRSEVYANSTVLSLWGYTRNGKGGVEDPCFIPGQDVALPPFLNQQVVPSSPFLEDSPMQTPPARDTLLFFAGFSGRGGGGNEAFSFGSRQLLFNMFENRTDLGFVIKEGLDGVFQEHMKRSIFCFAPCSAGFGTRAMEAIVLGCIPVVVQENVKQPYDGDLLDWTKIGVVLTNADLPRLPDILQAISDEERKKKMEALEAVWTRFAWTGPRLPSLSDQGAPNGEKWDQILESKDVFSSVMEVLEKLILRASKTGN